MSIYLAEFLGTFILILFGGGVVASVILKGGKAEDSGWNTIVVTWGLAVTFAIYATGSISGAHINPAVTLGLAYIGAFEWAKVPGYILAQILGGFTGGVLVWLFYIPHWSMTEDKGTKLGVFSTIPAVRSYLNNFVSEMVGTAMLLFALLFIGANEYSQGLNPLVVGALIILIGFGLGGTTGYAINPARDLGPRIAHFLMPIHEKGGSDWAYAPIPIFGPILGSLCGVSAYKMMYENDFQLQYIIPIIIGIFVLIATALQSIKNSKKIKHV